MARVAITTVGALLVGWLVLSWHPAWLEQRSAADQASDLAAQLMSPYCPGMTLATCPSPGAAELRREIAARLGAGEREGAIVDSLASRFGESLRGSPPPAGAGLALWVVPGLVGAAMLFYFVRVSRAQVEPPAVVRIGDEDRRLAAQLEEELHQLG